MSEFVFCEPGQTPSLSSLTGRAVLPAGLGPAQSRYGPQPEFKDSYSCWASATKIVRSPGVPSSGSLPRNLPFLGFCFPLGLGLFLFGWLLFCVFFSFFFFWQYSRKTLPNKQIYRNNVFEANTARKKKKYSKQLRSL